MDRSKADGARNLKAKGRSYSETSSQEWHQSDCQEATKKARMNTVLRQTYRLARNAGAVGAMRRSVTKTIPTGHAHTGFAPLPHRNLSTKMDGNRGMDLEDVERIPDEEEDTSEGVENLLEGKTTRENMRTAFKARSADAMRYDYFAQRADVESETDAAMTFRGLSECAKQQALGYLELMEEYGDADFGSSLENLDISAISERTRADGSLHDAGVVAGEEGFDEIEDWFEDMTDAGHRAATKLDAIHSLIEGEMMEGTEIGGDDSNENMGEELETVLRGGKK